MATTTTSDENQLMIDLTIIEMMMVKEAKQVLQDTILKEMDEMLTKVAVEAVKGFAKVKIQKNMSAENPYNSDVHIHFMQKVIKTIEANNPTVIVHKNK